MLQHGHFICVVVTLEGSPVTAPIISLGTLYCCNLTCDINNNFAIKIDALIKKCITYLHNNNIRKSIRYMIAKTMVGLKLIFRYTVYLNINIRPTWSSLCFSLVKGVCPP